MPKLHHNAVMAAATFAYFASVMQRSSMGVGSLSAVERFHTSATALSALAVFQLIVYAVMQIPVGVLLDRFGARILIIIGAASMTFGQLVVAFAETIELAYFGRMLVGLGDAFTFISMVRLIVAWNTSRQVPKQQQLLTSLGQLGQIASAVPFAILLANAGWQNAFSIAASVALLSVIFSVLFIRNEPEQEKHARHEMTIRIATNQLFENIRFAGVRMSFWTHFTLQSSGSVFALLWGVPYLVSGQGQSREFASSMLIFQTALGLVLGFFLGWLASNYPLLRVRVVVVVSIAIIFAWFIMALLPGRAPGWMLVLLVFVIATGGPASMLALDFSRTFTPKERLGSANGFVNVGGFLATFTTMALAGSILDLVQHSTGSTSPYTLEGFRWAMSAQIIVLVVGLAMFLVELRKTRRTVTV